MPLTAVRICYHRTYNRVMVCVCLYGFVFALSHSIFRRVRVCVCFLVSHPCETMGTHAKASLPCLPLPLHRPTPFPKPLQKNNTPSPRTTTLASLVKGRWIGGKAQTLTLLHLLAICSPFLFAKLFCRQDGGIATPNLFIPHSHFPDKVIKHPPATYICTKKRKQVTLW